MKDQIEMLENSLRTNTRMAKVMAILRQKILAKRYLANAYKDKRMLGIYRKKWLQDATVEYKTI